MKSYYSLSIIHILCILTLTLCACESDESKIRRANQREAIFNLEIVQGTGTDNTRSAYDGAISTVRILAFTDPNPTSTSNDFPSRLKYAYSADATNVSGNTYKATLTIIDGKKQHFVVLANYTATPTLTVDDNYNDILEQLKTDAITTPWSAATDIPMFGLPTETGVEISSTTNSIPSFSDIYLLRMMARIDIINGNKKTDAVTGDYNNFVMTAVKVYNMPKSGYPAHKKENLGTGTNRVLAPWVPDPMTFLGEQSYTPGTTTKGEEKIEDLIYTFENKEFVTTSWETVTYLKIIGDYYPDGIGNEATVRKNKTYTVYIPELQYNALTGEGEPKVNGNPKGAVLRNHHYIFTIGEVKEESIDFTARVVPWIEADQNIIFDGQYQLTLSRRKLIVDIDEALDVSLNIKTTYDRAGTGETPGTTPISITAPKGTWYKVRWADSDPNARERNLLISIDENDTGVERKDSITITSGNMNYVFEIKQLPDPWLYYKSYGALMDGEEYRIKASTAHFSPEVTWTAEIDENTNPLDGDRMMTQLLTKEGGGYTPVNPIHKEFFRYNATKSINEVPFEHVKFTVYDDWANILAGSPGKTHKFVTVVFTPILDNPDYYLQPKEVEVLIASADLETRESNCYMFDLADSGVNETESKFKRATLFTVSRANNNRLKTASSNFIEEFNGNFRIAEKNENAFNAEFKWTDSPYGIELRGNVSCIKAVPGVYNGTDYCGFIAVVPGARANGLTEHRGGNTLVAARDLVNDNEIKWSWHLWVHEGKGNNTKESVDIGAGTGNKWMDRNVGALANYFIDHFSKGLSYYWGRKDPFPIYFIKGSDTERIIPHYIESGKEILHRGNGYFGLDGILELVTLAESVQNPTIPYYGHIRDKIDGYDIDNNSISNWPYFWTKEYVLEKNQQQRWNDSSYSLDKNKSIFDPCPFGWRLPMSTEYSTTSASSDANSWNLPAYGGHFYYGTVHWSSTPYYELERGKWRVYAWCIYSINDDKTYGIFYTQNHYYTRGGSARCIKQ